ncbi:MAG TPA: hypothetical protein VGG82_07875 [Casimicrobiaceae bacterium]|jgi:hypothetical protein
MKIALGTVEITEDDRDAIAAFYGRQGPASREVCRAFVIEHGTNGVAEAQAGWTATKASVKQ